MDTQGLKLKVIGRTAMFAVVLATLTFLQPRSVAAESNIYVIREADGSIRFTNKQPPAGVKAEIFTARNGGFSVMRGLSSFGDKVFPDMYNRIIGEAARQHQVEPGLIKAVIHVESGFNAQAVSKRGARGLMQLMPVTARELGVRKPFEPNSNIQGGTQMLARLIKKYQGNVAYALAAYNAGEDAVRRYNGIPPYNETREYVKRVLHMKNRYTSVSNG